MARILVNECLMDSVELSNELLLELESLAKYHNINIDEYIMLLLEEEILMKITKSLLSDSSIF